MPDCLVEEEESGESERVIHHAEDERNLGP